MFNRGTTSGKARLANDPMTTVLGEGTHWQGEIQAGPGGLRIEGTVEGTVISEGQVLVDGVPMSALDDDAATRLRRTRMGFIFQAFHVLPHLDVAQNVALPLLLQQRPDNARVAEVLRAVGLGDLGARLPQQLSGGQLQRVAIARALVHRPALILADEPTGNLDPHTAEQVLSLLLAQTQQHGAALVLVTHSDHAAARTQRLLRLSANGITEQ